MKRMQPNLIWGILLLAAGILFLLQNMGFGGFAASIFWAFVFAVGGVAFLWMFASRRSQWWAAIPAFSLLGLAALIFIEALLPRWAGSWGGSIFLGAVGLGFWVVYFSERKNWWAVIPGGVLVTLALVAGVGSTFRGMDTGGIFFLGLGATFALVALLPTPQGTQRWAWFPAAGCLLMAIFLLAQAASILAYVWPLALVAGGIFLLYRAFFSRSRE